MYHSFISDRFYHISDPLVFWQVRNLLVCNSMTLVASVPRQTVGCKFKHSEKETLRNKGNLCPQQLMNFIGLFTLDYTYQMLHNELY